MNAVIIIGLVLAAVVTLVLVVANNAFKVKAVEKTIETDAQNVLNSASNDIKKL